MRIILTAITTILMGVVAAGAADDVPAIAAAWARTYGNLPERAEYHYRCRTRAVQLKPEVDLGIGYDSSAEFALELCRLGNRVRWQSIAKPDFREMATLGWMQGFDGRAAYVVQCQGRDYAVYSSRFKIDKLIARGQPFADPLAGVLGLSVPAATGIVKESPRAFAVEAALKKAAYRVTAGDGRTVTVADDGKDELLLNREHGYAVERRTWRWDGDRPPRCVIVNRDWKQFSGGAWYPASTDISYFATAETPAGDPCLKVTFRFSAMMPSTSSDFELIADRPGWTVTLWSPDGTSQRTTIQRGEAVNLTKVAAGDVPLNVAVHPADTRFLHAQAQREVGYVVLVVVALVTGMDIIGYRRRPRASQIAP